MENLFDAVARFEGLEFTFQTNRERKFSLAGFENEIAAMNLRRFPNGSRSASCSSLNLGNATLSVSR